MPRSALRRAIADHALRGYGLDLMIDGPRLEDIRTDVIQALETTTQWVGVRLHGTRVWVNLANGRSMPRREERAIAFEALCAVLGSVLEDVRIVSLVDWVIYPEFHEFQRGGNARLDTYDPLRADRIEAARGPLLTPWLDGHRSVRSLLEFRAFHTDLSPLERTAVRYVHHHHALRYTAISATNVPPGQDGWFPQALVRPMASGWVDVVDDGRGNHFLAPGHRARRMAMGQGELLAP